MRVLPWTDARRWLEQRWGSQVARVGVDAGLGCPHRQPEVRQSGCAFCSDIGNRPPYQDAAERVEEQASRGVRFARERYGASLFSLYFQASTSTWGPISTLKDLYDRGLSCAPFVDLTVGTRPDCLAPEVVELLAGYQSHQRDVWVEVGLQSSCDATLDRISRGHTSDDFRSAAMRLREAGLPVTAHVMFGLPGESAADFQRTIDFALDCGISGIKFHDLLLVPGTRLFDSWARGELKPVDPEQYLEAVAEALRRLPPEVVVWRVCSDPEDRRGPPSPGTKWPKNVFLNRLVAALGAEPAANDA